MGHNAGSARTADGIVHVERVDGVLRLTIDRPAQRNSLSHRMIATLVDALTGASADDTLRAVHLRGAQTDFCAGADWVATNSPDGQRPRTGHLARRIPHTANRVVELLMSIHLPVVCTVRGWAVGLGCNLALAADFTVAARGAVFWEPFVERGFSPDSGATWLLPRLAGVARARRMLLLGEKVSGELAADWGLIHQAAADAEVDAAAEDLLARLAAGPTVAIGLAKQALATSAQTTLGQAMTTELQHLEISCRTTDFKEGLNAFRERRTPDFGGR
ncbi:enoyl-CoA hydratase/isomerase family protein [Mycolicibacterium sp. S2-37]|uniref:enoyl-CoA hydratase/isomerase family protein n=1 Tax=Mycolicibacterium sp. S2-37 TaxID=2810297 RepID=UPI001A94D625|nr:enoyl-CoA hydratase-related protein [Mycolicibacterium sp. S2-37]MBO0677451.1 enoyl-CoA hydratase/isomerase family protein [Mycolicibacterium sp. S2-37]